jgi:hypothetical protein
MYGVADKVRAQSGHNHFSARSEVIKSLILKGEMLERSIRHAWKAMRWSHVETYRSTLSAALHRLSTERLALGVFP